MIFQMTSSCWFPTKELNIKLSRAEASCSGSIRTIRISSNMQNVVAEEPPLLRKILKPSGESGGDWPEAHQAPVQLRRRGVPQPSVLRALQAVSEERLRLQEYFSWSRKTGFISNALPQWQQSEDTHPPANTPWLPRTWGQTTTDTQKCSSSIFVKLLCSSISAQNSQNISRFLQENQNPKSTEHKHPDLKPRERQAFPEWLTEGNWAGTQGRTTRSGPRAAAPHNPSPWQPSWTNRLEGLMVSVQMMHFYLIPPVSLKSSTISRVLAGICHHFRITVK